jgi:DICT domain-containing protein
MSMPKWLLIALGQALEDEYAFQARHGVAIGAFQDEHAYRGMERRWRTLAEQSELALVLARLRDPSSGEAWPLEAPLDRASPLLTEWAVVCDCFGWSACIAGVEANPSREADGDGEAIEAVDRAYEAVWTMDAATVRAAARLLFAESEEWFPQLRSIVPMRVIDEPARDGLTPRALRELGFRFAEYAADARLAAASGARHRRLPDDFGEAWALAGSHEVSASV